MGSRTLEPVVSPENFERWLRRGFCHPFDFDGEKMKRLTSYAAAVSKPLRFDPGGAPSLVIESVQRFGFTQRELRERLRVEVAPVLMPRDSRKIYATQRIRVLKLVRAPASYVYEWCTDYRSDDWKVARPGTHPRFRVVGLSPHRVIRIRLTERRRSDPDVAVDLIRLEPPNRWHTDQIDEEELETVDYRVAAVGRERTRLEVRVTDRWTTPRFLSRSETAKRVSGAWDRYVDRIEARFRSGLPAKG